MCARRTLLLAAAMLFAACEEPQEPYLAIELTSPQHRAVGFIGEYGRDEWRSFAGTTPKTIVFHPWHVGNSGESLQVGARKTTDDHDTLRVRVYRNAEVIAEAATGSQARGIIIRIP